MGKEIIDISRMNEGDPIKLHVATWVNRLVSSSDRKIPITEAFAASIKIVEIYKLRGNAPSPSIEDKSGLLSSDSL